MYTPSLVKIHWYLLKLSSGNENMDLCRQITVKNWWNLPSKNPKPDLYNISAHNEFGENPLIFTQFIIRKRKYGQMDDRRMDVQTDGHTDSQRDTIIPRHYHVKCKKKKTKKKKTWLRLQKAVNRILCFVGRWGGCTGGGCLHIRITLV